MHVCLGGLTSGAGVTASPDPAGIVKPRVKDGRVFPPPAPDQSRRSLFDLVKHLHVPSACFHFAFESLRHLPFTTRCAYVCEWVSEWVRMCAACSCVQCVCENVCTCVFSYPCWYKLVTALAWTSLGVSAFFFYFFFLFKCFFLNFSLEFKTQESSLATH